MGNYLKMIDQQHIEALLELGWSYRRIERETGIRRETVARYDPRHNSKPDNLAAGSEAKPAKVTPGPRNLAEPYRDEIQAALNQGLTAQRIWQDLCTHGFPHGYNSVKRLVRRLKRAHPEVAGVMEHPPGKEAQVDFFQGPPTLQAGSGLYRRPWIFRMTLSCSRHSYEEAVWEQDQGHFLAAHEHAFEEFGGVMEVVRHDNLKAAVVRACLYDPDISVLYAAFAEHWGFVPLPARPRHPEEDGIAERGGGYVKDNALKGLRFDGLDELNAHLTRWNRTIARLRIHGTTRKQVYTHFLEADRPLLKSLPAQRFALFQVSTRKVHPDGHIEVGGAYYSVPHQMVGEEVRVQYDEHLLRVYAGGQVVAVHPRIEAGTYTTQDDHRPDHKPAREEAYLAGLLARAGHIGPGALAWAKAACDERGVRAYRLLQGMVSLTRKHPRERVDWACRLSLDNRLFRYRILRRLVEQAATGDAPAPVLIQQHALIRDLSEYTKEVCV